MGRLLHASKMMGFTKEEMVNSRYILGVKPIGIGNGLDIRHQRKIKVKDESLR